jgi:MarR family transcriptional regulator, lower aerobic nicotinate degradation pathway regulator
MKLNEPVPTAACFPAELLAKSGFLLAKLGWAFKARCTEVFEAEGFSPYHYSVLALLDEGARETQSAIADALELDRSQLVGLLDHLEEQGLVERRRDASDRRRHVVTLTPAGCKALVGFRALIDRLETELLDPLAPGDRAVLHGLLAQLAASNDPRYAAPALPQVAAASS